MAFEGKYLVEGVNLFDNQKHNVKCLVHRRRALLSDKVGSGKTLSCLYAFAYLKEKGSLSNMLVLTPLSAYEKDVWKKDIEKFTKLKCISVDEFCTRIDKGENIYVLLAEYSVIYGKHTHVKKEECIGKLKQICKLNTTVLIVDEVHAMKNPQAELTKDCKVLSKIVTNFWGITGSTISRDMTDLYHIVNMVCPGYFGKFNEFRGKYCKTREKKIGWDAYRMKPKTAIEIVGLKDTYAFKDVVGELLICGESFSTVKFHWLDYEMNSREEKLYKKISKGITLQSESDEAWLAWVLGDELVDVKPRMKDVEAFSSRFIYLQSVVDGTLNDDGTLDGCAGTKLDMLKDLILEKTSRGQSVIVYFDYLASLHAAERILDSNSYDILISSGEHTLKAEDVTEERCRNKPVVILGTRASSESASYYFINNVVFFDIPSVPHTFVQLVGRITRKNTLYPDDLNVYIYRSNNIDLYKMLLVSSKAYQMELVQGHEGNIPDDYKKLMSDAEMRDVAKKVLLWGDRRFSTESLWGDS